MDIKTFEYMKTRTNAYIKLKSEAEELKKCKERLSVEKGLRLGTFHNTYCFDEECEVSLKIAIEKAIDERIQELEKKMEDI